MKRSKQNKNIELYLCSVDAVADVFIYITLFHYNIIFPLPKKLLLSYFATEEESGFEDAVAKSGPLINFNTHNCLQEQPNITGDKSSYKHSVNRYRLIDSFLRGWKKYFWECQ